MPNNSSSSDGVTTYHTNLLIGSAVGIILTLAAFVISVLFLIHENTNTPISTSNQNLIIGVIIVLAVSVLLLLLFGISVGYYVMQLSNSNEALGLPPGSIRALIALLLILIWVIVSIFLFSGIGQQTTVSTTVTDATTHTTTTTTNGAPDAIKLGQQFYTTMSTLVVAIAAFYFGSSTFRSGGGTQMPASPTVSSMSPSSGPAAGGTSITITGSGFTGATGVVFGPTPASSFTVHNDTQIVAISPAGSGTVDVAVTTPNGTSATGAADQFSYT
jgi:hypothetical protein